MSMIPFVLIVTSLYLQGSGLRDFSSIYEYLTVKLCIQNNENSQWGMMCEKQHRFLAWHPKNPNRNEPGRIQCSKAVSKCPKMHVHTCNRAVPHLSTASVLSLGSTAQLFPSQHEPVIFQGCSPRTSYLTAVTCNSSSISPPISHSISHPIPLQHTLAPQPL